MTGDRLQRILDLAEVDADSAFEWARLCADAVNMTGAGAMLISDDVSQGSVCNSDKVSALVEELQFTLGEGPSLDAYHQDRPVLEPDLAEPHSTRWLAFTSAAEAAGVRAMFSFPMKVGGARFGALNLYRDRPGNLSADEYVAARFAAVDATRMVVAMQASAPAGMLRAEVDATSVPFCRASGSGRGVGPSRHQHC